MARIIYWSYCRGLIIIASITGRCICWFQELTVTRNHTPQTNKSLQKHKSGESNQTPILFFPSQLRYSAMFYTILVLCSSWQFLSPFLIVYRFQIMQAPSSGGFNNLHSSPPTTFSPQPTSQPLLPILLVELAQVCSSTNTQFTLQFVQLDTNSF